ncbi:MAG: hypothetical protein ACP5KB_04480 [Thermoprotei archaeon]
MNGPLENIFSSLPLTFQDFLMIVIMVVVAATLRFVISWLIANIAKRGVISPGTKILITRIIDIVIIVMILIGVVSIVTASLVPYVVVFVIALLSLLLFYNEVKEFSAYINIQFMRLRKNPWVEVYLPGIDKPLTCRILDISPFNTVLEDVFGNKIYVPNTVLSNSVYRARQPHVVVRLGLSITHGIASTGDFDCGRIVSKVSEVARDVLFRVETESTLLRVISPQKAEIVVSLVPVKLPVRATDVTRLTTKLSEALKDYMPEIEVVRIS